MGPAKAKNKREADIDRRKNKNKGRAKMIKCARDLEKLHHDHKKWAIDKSGVAIVKINQHLKNGSVIHKKLPRSFENHLNFILKSFTNHKSCPLPKNAITIPILKIGLLKKTKSLLFTSHPTKRLAIRDLYFHSDSSKNPLKPQPLYKILSQSTINITNS